MISRRNFVIGSSLALGGAANWAAMPRTRRAPPSAPDIASLLPRTIDGRKANEPGDIILAPDNGLAANPYDQLVARRYSRQGSSPITLLTAYGPAQSYASQIHRPELCYPASGFELVDQSTRFLTIGGARLPARLIEAKRGSRRDLVLFWVRIGDAYPLDLWDQRFEIAQSVLTGGDKSGILVRISLPTNADAEDTGRLESFAQSLYDRLNGIGRNLLFGPLV